MFGLPVKFKDSKHDEDVQFDAFKAIKLTESHEAGEIIDGYYLILNRNTFSTDIKERNYPLT